MPGARAIPSMLRALALLAAIAFPPSTAAVPALPDDLALAVAQLEQRLQRDPRRVSAADLDAYFHEVLCRLDPVRCGGSRTLVLRDPGFNASIAPGGLIVLRTGALLRCHDEAELALVLAHELAHERRGDARERWRRAGAGIDDGRGHHSREAEAAADATAIAMLAAAGYDIAAGERLWTRLVAEEARGAPKRRTSGGTHPQAADRLAAFRKARERLGGAGESGDTGDRGGERWRQRMAPYRQAWLDHEVTLGRPTANVAMLEAALDSTGDPRVLDRLALGQALRRRDEPGDRQRAAGLFAEVVGQADAPAAAWREHGLARLADGDAAGGKAALTRYLELDPGAADADFVAAMRGDGRVRGNDATPTPSSVARAPGALRVFDLRLRTPLPWLRHRGIGLEQWTLDGIDRNRLLVVPNLRPGEPLFRDAGRTGPVHRPGLPADLQRDQVVAALDAAGWIDVHADGPRPHDFGGVPGWHSNLSLASAEGARYRGSVAFTERDGRLTLLLWFALAEPYFTRDAAAVEATLASVRFED